jgi:hypothetical protein
MLRWNFAKQFHCFLLLFSLGLLVSMLPGSAREYGVIDTNEFMAFASACPEQTEPSQSDHCAFAQGFFLGAIGGLISADRYLSGTIRQRHGCGEFASKPIKVLFYEFRTWMSGRPEAELATDPILQFIADRYPCPTKP